MKWIIKFWWVCVFPFSSISGNQLDSIVIKADSAFNQESYGYATIMYEKVAFLSDNQESSCKAMLMKSKCYRAMNDLTQASITLNRIHSSIDNDTLNYDVFYEKMLCHFLKGDYSEAENDMLQMQFQIQDTNLLQHSWPLQIMILNESYKYEESRALFNKYLEINQLELDLDSMYRPIEVLKNPGTAKLLSGIVPGSGQIYAGGIRQGVSTFMLESTTLVYAWYCFSNKLYAAGVFTAINYFAKFYFGGQKNATHLALDFNSQTIKDMNRNIRQTLVDLQGRQHKGLP